MKNSTRMPVFFLAHGSPMNAIENNPFSQDWLQMYKNTPTPTAIVCFSAHWHVPGTRVLNVEKPETIHDFGGFPRILHEQQYPAPGHPALAKALVQALQDQHIPATLDSSWGLDHGTWSLLTHLHPEANIPVLQISLDNQLDDGLHHWRIGKALRAFRDEGVLFIGSGNIVHNIRKWMTSQPNDAIDWAVEFDAAIAAAIRNNDLKTICEYLSLPYARVAVPTIEHFLPLLYVLGLSDENDELRFSDFGFSDLSTACSRSLRFSPKV